MSLLFLCYISDYCCLTVSLVCPNRRCFIWSSEVSTATAVNIDICIAILLFNLLFAASLEVPNTRGNESSFLPSVLPSTHV